MVSSTEIDQLELTRAGADELQQVRAIISSAICAWPISDRLKRNAMRVLSYDVLDLEDMQIIIARKDGQAAGVAAWSDQACMADPAGKRSALLHGLYVSQEWQRHGIGKCLQQAAAAAVKAVGGFGLHVRAERFAAPYFERSGYRRLGRTELVDTTGSYEHRYWSSCSNILGPATDPVNRDTNFTLPGYPFCLAGELADR